MKKLELPALDATLADVQNYVRQMGVERGFANHSIEQKFVKLLEELGELAQVSSKKVGLSISKERDSEIAEEAADVFIVFLDLCNKLNVDLTQAFLAKETKNQSREWK